MKTPDLFKEYIWLVNTIHKAGRISLADINEKWKHTEMSGGMEISRSTFNRHKDAIEEIFDIIIDCDRKDGNRYYISNEDVLHQDTVQNWMLSTLSVNNLVSESMSLQHRILLESIPVDGDLLRQIIDAMRTNHRINIIYKRYGASASNTFDISPYCIKLFRQRWYVLGGFENGNAGVFSFDRIEYLKILKETFKLPKSFDAADYFSECYGIVAGDGTKAERIVIRAYGNEKYYLQDLPLHHSQRELAEKDDYTDFELYLRPTSDFKAHLLSRGRWQKVLEPTWLADEIRQWHEEAVEIYK
jgi:hypothetical protein